jgi:hypothetical protein
VLVLHDALDFGQCHLALGVPMGGRFADVHTLQDLKAMPWSEQAPLRCAVFCVGVWGCRGSRGRGMRADVGPGGGGTRCMRG